MLFLSKVFKDGDLLCKEDLLIGANGKAFGVNIMQGDDMKESKIDSALDGVALNQLVWKSESCKKIAVRICQKACACADAFFPDEISHEGIADADANVVGSMFRYLASKKYGKIIARTGSFRRSKAEGAHGRTVFAYVLTSRALAESLVKRHDSACANPQQEMKL